MPERIKEAGVEEVVKANGAAAVNGSNGDRPANRAAPADDDAAETKEWLDALDSLIQARGEERARYILTELKNRANVSGVHVPFTANTPYINTIPVSKQPLFPGNRDVERRLKSLVRWNAMAMVVRANKKDGTLGGHIATFASSATLYEIGFNHFFHGPDHPDGADQVYFQGHASPGIYARAFLEGRLAEEKLLHFRQELAAGGGLSSYPHPWLMPDFWQFPTVSMGLGPIMAIYQARFNRYLEHRGLAKTAGQHVWCFMGDGECDEPESLGALTLASREGLDNLIFVVNCNLQRLDGPVRGNGKIIQELEAAFRGAGWKCIKVIWGGDWDMLLERDRTGLLVRRMGEVVDGEFQKFTVAGGAYFREHFFGKYPELLKLVEHMTDEQLEKMKRGGHDPEKVYAAFKAAVEYKERPTVILAHTVKGYGLGEAGEGKNIAHQIKKMDAKQFIEFRNRFGLAVPDEAASKAALYKPDEDSEEIQYLKKHREALGGPQPAPAGRNARRCRRPARISSRPTRPAAATRSRPRPACSWTSWLACCATRTSASTSCRSCRTRRAPSAWTRSSPSTRSTATSASCTSRWTRSSSRPPTARPRTASSWRRASPRPARCVRSSRPARPTPRTACR